MISKVAEPASLHPGIGLRAEHEKPERGPGILPLKEKIRGLGDERRNRGKKRQIVDIPIPAARERQ